MLTLLSPYSIRHTLLLAQQVIFDSVEFIIYTCNIKNKQINHYSLLKKTVKLHQLRTSFQVNLEVCLKESISSRWFKSI